MKRIVKRFFLFVLMFLFTSLVYSQEGMEIIRKMARGEVSVIIELKDFDKVKDIEEVEVKLFGVMKNDRRLLETKVLNKNKNKAIFWVSKGDYEVEFSVPGDTNGFNFMRKLFVKGDKGVNVKQSVLGLKGSLILYCGFEGEDEIKSLGGVINRFYRNDYEEITFVDGYRGKGMWVRGEHGVENTTYDQVFLPVGNLTSEKGTIEFMFKPVDWDSNDGCAAHYLLDFVSYTNNSRNRYGNFREGYVNLRFEWNGWEKKYCINIGKIIGLKDQWDYLGEWSRFIRISIPEENSKDNFKFNDSEWLKFRIVWSKNKDLLGGYSVVVFVNGKRFNLTDADIPEVVAFGNFLAVGMFGGWWWWPAQDANMYQNACGIFDELYVWNYPKLD